MINDLGNHISSFYKYTVIPTGDLCLFIGIGLCVYIILVGVFTHCSFCLQMKGKHNHEVYLKNHFSLWVHERVRFTRGCRVSVVVILTFSATKVGMLIVVSFTLYEIASLTIDEDLPV